MTEYEKLKNELDLLKVQVGDLEKQVYEGSSGNSAGEGSNSGEGSGNTGEGSGTTTPAPATDPWIVIYDKDSTDPAINLGLTAGVTGTYGKLNALPDVTPYKTMRVRFSGSGSHQYHYFDISEPATGGCRFMTNNLTSTQIIGANITVGFQDNKQYVYVGNFTLIKFAINKYPVITDLKTDKNFFISKIEVKTSAM